MVKTCLVIHGGAGSKAFTPSRRESYQDSVRAILQAVEPELKKGLSATEAVTWACRLLEDDPLFNAGKGSKIQSDGHIRMSASLMDGHKRRFAGCVNVERVKNPILLARTLMSRPDRVLAEGGALRFAKEQGLELASPFTLEQRTAFKRKTRGKSGTVGAIALDRKGRLAAATSTGGKGFEYPHRVSDSPTAAGNFANGVCAVSATGTGEEIVEFGAAAAIGTLVEAGWPLARAVNHVLSRARRSGAEFGLIALDATGAYVADTTTPALVWGAVKGGDYVADFNTPYTCGRTKGARRRFLAGLSDRELRA